MREVKTFLNDRIDLKESTKDTGKSTGSKTTKMTASKRQVPILSEDDVLLTLGRTFVKDFPPHGAFTGTVTSWDTLVGIWKVVYDDGDEEELEHSDLLVHLENVLEGENWGGGGGRFVAEVKIWVGEKKNSGRVVERGPRRINPKKKPQGCHPAETRPR